MVRDVVLELPREGFAPERQMFQRQRFGRLLQDAFEVGRHAAHEGDRGAVELEPELIRRLSVVVADDDRGAAAHEGQERLLDRGVER